jgi:hypothetical protein
MNNIQSPWFDFPIPSETIAEAELLQSYSDDTIKYARLMLIKRLRESANYWELLPIPDRERFTENELKTIAESDTNLNNPNTYAKIGESVYSSELFKGIQTFNVLSLGKYELPAIRFRVSRFVGTDTIYDLLLNSDNELQLNYWLSKTKILDTTTAKFTDISIKPFEQQNTLSRSLLEDIDYVDTGSLDVELVEKLRQRTMLNSEREFYNYILNDKLGFFGGIGGISSPKLTDDLALRAFATDNRRQFYHTNVPEYISSVGNKDYINFRFEIININGEDFFEVKWCFPQAERISFGNGMDGWTNRELLQMLTKR